MDISRIQIEGGFLDSVDLHLQGGLNVIIGARGTGKTSLIELIRYGLGAKSHTPESEVRAVEHAESILQDGEVTLTLEDLFSTATVARSVGDEHPRSASEFSVPIVLSQTEIETIGLNPNARLSLIDGFIKNKNKLATKKAEIKNLIINTYKEIKSLEDELTENTLLAEKLSLIDADISKLIAEQDKFKINSAEIDAKHQELLKVSAEITTSVLQTEMLDRFVQKVGEWEQTIDYKLSQEWDSIEVWDQEPATDPLKDLRVGYDGAIRHILEAKKEFVQQIELARSLTEIEKEKKESLESKARAIRTYLESQNEGLGRISRQLSLLQTDRQRCLTAIKLHSEKMLRLGELRKRRDDYFAEFCRIVELRSSQREDVARMLNQGLQPQIKVHVERAVDFSSYVQSLTNALRGSGIKYNDLSIFIAERVSPRELMECTDTQDYQRLSEIADIPKDRAIRLLSALKEAGMAEIVTTEIGDNIKLCLLDGDYKDTTALSAGQRCTVILSIVLQHRDRTLVIDQPEDHLDNAFIADTVIHALKERGQNGQVIVATHNANIPVLGNAALVIHLTSDGKNGFVQTAKPLAHPKSIAAITRVMEGGYEAFRARSNFYESDTI